QPPASTAPAAARPAPASLDLRLHWARDLRPQRPAWPDQARFQADSAPRPVVADGLLILASAREDCVAAFDAGTGEARSRFDARAPPPFPPPPWPAPLS